MTTKQQSAFDLLMQQAEACLLKIDECQKTSESAAAKLGEAIATIKQVVEANDLYEQFTVAKSMADPVIIPLPIEE